MILLQIKSRVGGGGRIQEHVFVKMAYGKYARTLYFENYEAGIKISIASL